MELKVMGVGQGSAGSVQLSEANFGREFNEALVHQVVTAYMAAGRAGTKAQKTRAEVAHTTAKPWRQKGTGRARAGMSSSPLWRGGGQIFAAKPRDYSQKVNKKMYRAAMQSILSELVRQGRLLVVDTFAVDTPKTKLLSEKLKGMGLDNVLIVADKVDDNLYLSARNLAHVDVCDAQRIDPVRLVAFDKVLMTVSAVKAVEEMLA